MHALNGNECSSFNIATKNCTVSWNQKIMTLFSLLTKFKRACNSEAIWKKIEIANKFNCKGNKQTKWMEMNGKEWKCPKIVLLMLQSLELADVLVGANFQAITAEGICIR